MESVWEELVAVRRAGRAQVVTSECATRSASNTEPARMESASVTRAGTESTAPLVSTSVYLFVGVCLMCVCVLARECAQKHQAAPFHCLKEFGNEKWRQKRDLRELKKGNDVGGG